MKNTSIQTLLFIALLAGSHVAAFATTANATGSVRVDHDYHAVLRDIPLDNACITNTEVRSLKPVRTCIQLDRFDEPRHQNSEPMPTWTCRNYADVTLAYPRKITVQICNDTRPPKSSEYFPIGVCSDWSTTTLTLPRSIEVRVTPILTRDAPDPAAQIETITFPDCPTTVFP